ncbi:sigma 54-interacting transcriptional regulator [Salibacteraceae bacterium]|jgi:magnesium chelatase subunit I|nr:sigma 54-interacting transcriptional regulator [Salibacteraceae bacterium]
MKEIKTLGELKKSKYTSRSVKDELRANLIVKLRSGEKVFPGVLGYDTTVIPSIQNAILAKHNISLLGLRGQAKTSIARAMTGLLDEYIPVVSGAELNDDPLNPISKYAKDLIVEMGDKTPIEWMHRDDRYTEKLATPDVTVADLIGDLDPIKAANLKLNYSDERAIHFGLVPKAHRGLFVINELPDLQARIQVALFNILQEGDIQIRGFKLRLPLDIQFVFTANPEDYTNRGSIITPLKDRIQSQILTHYPKSLEIAREITEQEAKLSDDQRAHVEVAHFLKDLVEEIAFVARDSEYIDQKSGVSARLSITAYENLVSTAERRAIVNGESKTQARVGDIYAVVPAITGKVELVYEGEQEGPDRVANRLLGAAIRKQFPQYFPDPEMIKRRKETNPYQEIINWFGSHELDLMNGDDEETFRLKLDRVQGLDGLVAKYFPRATDEQRYLLKEFALHGLAEYSMLGKNQLEEGLGFSDILGEIFSSGDDDYDESPKY